MEIEFIKNKVYYKIIDRTYPNSNGSYFLHKAKNATELAQVHKNISNIKADFGYDELFLMHQVHGSDVIFVDPRTDFTIREVADASITTERNIALGILTADCVPILFASSDGNIIGAAHCGWRSARANIITNVRKLMEGKGARDIKAIIGPAIAQKSYEVDAKYYHDFLSEGDNIAELFIKSAKEGFFQFDLVSYVAQKLKKENITVHHNIMEDTYTNPEKYPSYRRFCHTGEPYLENILSTIIIK